MIRKTNILLTLMFAAQLLVVFFSIAIMTVLIVYQHTGFYVFGSSNNDQSINYECKNQYVYTKHHLFTNFRLRRSFVFNFLTGMSGLVSVFLFIDFVYGLKLIKREYTGLVEED